MTSRRAPSPGKTSGESSLLRSEESLGSRCASPRRRAGRILVQRSWTRLGQEPAEIGESGPQLVAVHDHVHHPMLLQIFGTLEAVWQFLADGLLDDTGAGKPDERTGFCEVHIPQHGIGSSDAPGGRVGQNDDVGLSRLAHHLDRYGCTRKLHKGKNALLHARAPRGGEHDERRALVDCGLQALDHCFAGRHAKRPAHEIEVLHPDHYREALKLAEPELDGIVGAGLAACILEALRVAALIPESQRIDWNVRDRHVEPGLVVEHRFQPRRRAHPHVIVRTGDHELVRFHVLVEHELPRFRTLDPEMLGCVAPDEVVSNLRADDVGYPVHATFIYNGAQPASISPPRALPPAQEPRVRSPASRKRTPAASCATRPVTASTVRCVALPLSSRLSLTAETSADPTTTPSAPRAIAAAWR